MAKDFYTSGLPANKQERIPFEKREEFPPAYDRSQKAKPKKMKLKEHLDDADNEFPDKIKVRKKLSNVFKLKS
jgi:hypothetical protein